MKSLNRIMILYKIFRIVWIILFALCIAGAAGIVLGLSIFSAVKDLPIPGGKTITQTLAENGVSVNAAYLGMSIGLVWCGAIAFLSMYLSKFCKEVIDQGTPFTRPLLRKMRIVAIVHMSVSLGASILCGIGIGIARAFDSGLANFHNNGYFSLSFGLFLLVLSLFMEYPIEKEELEHKEVLPEPEIIEEPKQEE